MNEKFSSEKQAMEMAEDARDQSASHQSFAAGLFVGRFQADLLLPFPQQSQSDRAIAAPFLEQITTVMREKLDPDRVDRTGEIPKIVIDELAALGAFAIKVPEEYGGLGFSQYNYNSAIMRVASYCASTAVLLSAHQSIGVPQPLKMFGSEEQRAAFLPRFRKGAISAFALTEPEVGSDPAQISSEARLAPDGSHYILNGLKLWCTNGPIADLIIVIAKTAPKVVDGHEKKQLSAFILEMNTPGVEVIQRCQFMGLKGIYNGMLRFTDVNIPRSNLLGSEGRGLAMALATINVGRLTLPAACTGIAKSALAIARRWGNERIQWGKPIGKHEAGREKIAYIASTTLAMEAITWLTTLWHDKGYDTRIEAAMAKLFCTESLWRIVDLTLQLRGGRGYENAESLKARGELPFPVERMMRDCRINTILEGSSEIMRLFLAREALDSHLKLLTSFLRGKDGFTEKVAAAMRFISYCARWYPQLWLPRFLRGNSGDYSTLGPLSKHYRYLESASRQLARTFFHQMIRYRKKLIDKQLLLGHLVDISCELFAIAAVCSYASSLKQQNSNCNAPDLADYFCALSRKRVAAAYSSLKDNDWPQGRQLSENILDNKALWLEEGIIMPF